MTSIRNWRRPMCRQEVEDAVRDGRKDCYDAKGNFVCRYTIEHG